MKVPEMDEYQFNLFSGTVRMPSLTVFSRLAEDFLLSQSNVSDHAVYRFYRHSFMHQYRSEKAAVDLCIPAAGLTHQYLFRVRRELISSVRLTFSMLLRTFLTNQNSKFRNSWLTVPIKPKKGK
jgi:hypothetical protein